MLQLIHGRRFTPSDEQRDNVRIMVWNQEREEDIAAVIGCSLDELRYQFHQELNYSQAQLRAIFTRNIFELSTQRVDLGVALKASELATRSVKAFRLPKDEPEAAPIIERVESLTENEVDREIQRVLGRRAAAEPADAQEAPARPEGEAD